MIGDGRIWSIFFSGWCWDHSRSELLPKNCRKFCVRIEMYLNFMSIDLFLFSVVSGESPEFSHEICHPSEMWVMIGLIEMENAIPFHLHLHTCRDPARYLCKHSLDAVSISAPVHWTHLRKALNQWNVNLDEALYHLLIYHDANLPRRILYTYVFIL